MKRSGKVVNAKALRLGRDMAKWAATGMNWGDGPERAALMSKAEALLTEGSVALAAFGKDCLREEFLTQSSVTALFGLTSEAFAGRINCGAPYYQWVGWAGYDTRPYQYLRGHSATHLPVQYRVEYASNHSEGWDSPAGDVQGFLESLPLGAVVDVPHYHGSTPEGYTQYLLTVRGWVCKYHEY